ncbi:Hypothetical_protein [Hexamita inflata]|uniref:Hypothetical_protein n=1 Tax=Hexamita inflata TaxID=28002 RepID=A0AA86NPP6_9EUKA|nr:Hypothetical protein HINF_LOCUS11158 [Hexamita inflata]
MGVYINLYNFLQLVMWAVGLAALPYCYYNNMRNELLQYYIIIQSVMVLDILHVILKLVKGKSSPPRCKSSRACTQHGQSSPINSCTTILTFGTCACSQPGPSQRSPGTGSIYVKTPLQQSGSGTQCSLSSIHSVFLQVKFHLFTNTMFNSNGSGSSFYLLLIFHYFHICSFTCSSRGAKV